jgi:dihydroorotase
MWQKAKEGKISKEMVVEKMSHNVAKAYKLKERGFIREGYKADLVLLNPNNKTSVTKESLLYKCGWSPLMNSAFDHSIEKVWINGSLSYSDKGIGEIKAQRLMFDKDR